MPIGAEPMSVRFGRCWAAAAADTHAANANTRNCQCTGLEFDIEPPWALEPSRRSIRLTKKKSLELLQAQIPMPAAPLAPAQAPQVHDVQLERLRHRLDFLGLIDVLVREIAGGSRGGGLRAHGRLAGGRFRRRPQDDDARSADRDRCNGDKREAVERSGFGGFAVVHRGLRSLRACENRSPDGDHFKVQIARARRHLTQEFCVKCTFLPPGLYPAVSPVLPPARAKILTRLRPSLLASYRAWSAARRRPCASVTWAGHSATPSDAVTPCRSSASRLMAEQISALLRCALSSVVLGSTTANSSPP